MLEDQQDLPSPHARIVPHSEEGKKAHGDLKHYAAAQILRLLSSADVKSLNAEYVETTIRAGFVEAGRWHVELGDIGKNGMAYWRNAIHFARKELVEAGLLVPSKKAPEGNYLLCVTLDQVKEKLPEYDRRSEEFWLESEDGRNKPRTRRSTEASQSDAVYVISDPLRPGWCKIGSGIGKCEDRLVEAQRWTRGEARLLKVFEVGPGNGLEFEKEIHRILKKTCENKLEWFKCLEESISHAVRQARENIAARRSVKDR